MKASQLKKGLIFRGIIYILVIFAMSQLYLGLDRFYQSLFERNTWLRNDINSLQAKLRSLNQKAREFNEAVKLWESFSEEKKKLQGIRINDAKDILDALKKEYRIAHLEITFSKPAELKDAFRKEAVGAIESIVTIKFEGITDEDMLAFTEALITYFPGYMQIRTFNLARAENVTLETLERIASGDLAPIVKGDMEFMWRDLKYYPAAPPTTATEKKTTETTETTRQQ